MSAISGALQHNHQNPTVTHSSTAVFNLLDPISLILSHNSSDSFDPMPLRLTMEAYFMERGPRYSAYAELRESKLRTKMAAIEAMFCQFPVTTETETWRKTPPAKKQVKFKQQSHLPPPATVSRRASGYGAASMLAQSMPDFSATLRKENRKPPTPVGQLTPPPSKNGSKLQGVLSSRGSRSVGSGEKKRGIGLMGPRKSYANVEELKGLPMAAASNSISDGRVISIRGNGGKIVLGHRQFF